MKLIKKLLIPGVALSVLFGFSYGLEGNFGGVYMYQKINRSDICVLSGNNYNCSYNFSDVSVSDNIFSGFNISKYSILSYQGNPCSVDLLYSINNSSFSIRIFNRQYCSINNNIYNIIRSSNNTYSFVCGNTNNPCPSNFYFQYYISSFNNVIYDYKSSIYSDNGEFGISSTTSNEIGQGTSQGFSNLLHFIIQFLPLMIFVFIIGYIIRKILIRFGMLKSPGVALNSKTYNKGKK